MSDYSLPPIDGDLSLVPLERLIEEIEGRVQASVILLVRDEETRSSDCRYSGNYYTALGLMQGYASDLLHFDLENSG